MSGPQGRGSIRELLNKHGHRPNKTLGQHFLSDPNLVDRIVRMAHVGHGDSVVEIGAGTGTLTLALAATGANVVAYEIDRHLEPLLAEVLADVNVDLRFADVTAIDIDQELDGAEWTLVANLPYNVGTPLVLDLLKTSTKIKRMVVMVQREVAERFAAEPGSRVYGLPSVIVGLRGSVASSFTVSPNVFIPAPDVESAVIEIVRGDADPAAGRAESIAAAAFGQRRKMLRRSLASTFEDPVAVLQACGIDPTRRAETVSPQEFLALAHHGPSADTAS